VGVSFINFLLTALFFNSSVRIFICLIYFILHKGDQMLDIKSLILGAIFGISIVFFMGATHKKGKKGHPPSGMFQIVAIPNNDSKAIILHTASGEFKIANIGVSPNYESGDRFMGPPPE